MNFGVQGLGFGSLGFRGLGFRSKKLVRESSSSHSMTICTSNLPRTGQSNVPTFCVKSFGVIAGYH